jgi:hypothetical protein
MPWAYFYEKRSQKKSNFKTTFSEKHRLTGLKALKMNSGEMLLASISDQFYKKLCGMSQHCSTQHNGLDCSTQHE